MELVVDANIIVAGFLRSATTRQLLLIGYSLPKKGAGRQSVPSRRRLRLWNGGHMGLTGGYFEFPACATADRSAAHPQKEIPII